MPSISRATLRQYWVAIRAMLVFTAALGIAYPLVITGIGQLAFNSQANGSKISADAAAGLPAGSGTTGSSLIGQSFTDKNGMPLTQWFQSRPSAAGTGYDANDSSPSNLGPNNPKLVTEIEQRKSVIEKTYGVTAAQIPADAVTASGSGLDPAISIAYADLQIAKVAETRGLGQVSVRALVERNTHGRSLGYLGQPYVNVVQLNLDLAKMDPSGNQG